MIQAALGDDADAIIPLLNQHRLIRVSVPIALIRLLNHQARIESATHHLPRNASDILERILLEYAKAHDAATVEREIRGFAQALTYPYFTPRRTGVLQLRCRYCGISITEPTREVCRACDRRHEPNEHLGEYGLPELDEPHENTPPPSRDDSGTRHQNRRRRTRPT